MVLITTHTEFIDVFQFTTEKAYIVVGGCEHRETRIIFYRCENEDACSYTRMKDQITFALLKL